MYYHIVGRYKCNGKRVKPGRKVYPPLVFVKREKAFEILAVGTYMAFINYTVESGY